MKKFKSDVEVYTNENLSKDQVVGNTTPLSSIGDTIYVERSAFFEQTGPEEEEFGMMIKDALYRRIIRGAKSEKMEPSEETSKIKGRRPLSDTRTRKFFSKTSNGIEDSLEETRSNSIQHFQFMLPRDLIMEFFTTQGVLGQKLSSILRHNRDFQDSDADVYDEVPLIFFYSFFNK